MTRFISASLIAAAAVCLELLLPGEAVYHSGWYNVALAALLIVAAVSARGVFTRTARVRSRLGTVAVAAGAIVVGTAGVANGLFAPDNRNIIGAPGQRVRVESLGTLSFPLVDADATTVTLERPLHAPLQIGPRRRSAGSFMLRTLPRSVVYVEARDLRGYRLTVTQPQGAVFLSPVLLMQQHQTIVGMDVPFDSFNVPSAARVIKAILFDPQQAAAFLHDPNVGGGAVLFAVDDENDRPLAHGIALSAGGREVRAANLRLGGEIVSYPQVEVVPVPNLAAVLIGLLLLAGGIIARI
ncbi:MAG TPA: hypothetical protein VHS56_09650 [Candidatus Cybelea sp.]|nr:hypothetical protein [Candidatus Cybelea sp.]